MADICGGVGREAAERKKGGWDCPIEFQWKTHLLERFLNVRHRWKRTAVKELNIIGIIEKLCSIMFEG